MVTITIFSHNVSNLSNYNDHIALMNHTVLRYGSLLSFLYTADPRQIKKQ